MFVGSNFKQILGTSFFCAKYLPINLLLFMSLLFLHNVLKCLNSIGIVGQLYSIGYHSFIKLLNLNFIK